MRQRNPMDRQSIFYLISNLEEKIDKGEKILFPSEKKFHHLIDYYEGEYLFDRALEVVGYASLQFTSSLDFCLRKAELLLQMELPEQALATLDRADSLIPGHVSTALLRAEGFAALDMYEEAIALLENLREQVEDDTDLSRIYAQEGLIYHHRKNYEREYWMLNSALQIDPNNSEALSRMWYCVEAARKHRESVELHKEIIEKNPFSALAWYNLGASQQYLTNYEEAIEAYEYAFLNNPDFAFAYRACADVCMLVEDYKKALECYQELVERFEPDEDVFLCIGKCYENLKNFPVARTFFHQALTCNPLGDEAFYGVGKSYAGQKKWKKAIDFYLRAIRLNDSEENYFAALGHAFFQSGNYKDAEIHLKAAADIAPETADYWIRLARFYMDTQQLDAALGVLDESEEYTYDPKILYYRSAFLFKMGQRREALLVLEEALCEDFEAHNSMFSLLPIMAKDSEVKAVISIFQPD